MRSAEALIFFDNGVYGLDDGGLEALLFKDMHALDRRAAGRGDLVDQCHRVLAGFLAELRRAERCLAGDFLRERSGKPGLHARGGKRINGEDASKFSCFFLYQWRLFLSWHSGRT